MEQNGIYYHLQSGSSRREPFRKPRYEAVVFYSEQVGPMVWLEGTRHKGVVDEIVQEYLAEIFRTNCGKCTKEQKSQTKMAFKKLKEKRPLDFAKVFTKYNPNNTHLASFSSWLKTPEP